ncbi:hypothetical protein RQP46_003003 [Phenoliferia psychrophenolica]
MSTSAIPALILYSAKVCPWAQRATLALQEVGAKYEKVEIDLKNKPDWYAEKINPASKVPVLDVGGTKIPESHVLLELVGDLYKDTDKSILPETPLLRAEARYFIERFNQVVWTPAVGIFFQGKVDEAPAVLKGILEIQGLLKRHPGPFAVGEKISIADLGVLPFIGRIFALGKAGLLQGGIYEEVTTNDQYKDFVAYASTLMARPSFAATFDEAYIVESMKARLAQAAK